MATWHKVLAPFFQEMFIFGSFIPRSNCWPWLIGPTSKILIVDQIEVGLFHVGHFNCQQSWSWLLSYQPFNCWPFWCHNYFIFNILLSINLELTFSFVGHLFVDHFNLINFFGQFGVSYLICNQFGVSTILKAAIQLLPFWSWPIFNSLPILSLPFYFWVIMSWLFHLLSNLELAFLFAC